MTTSLAPSTPSAVVSSHNEWDPLEEVIVGVLDGACVPPWDDAYKAMIHNDRIAEVQAYHREYAGRRFTKNELAPAQKELDGFVRLLEAEGVVVRRTDPVDQAQAFQTPDFSCSAGNAQSDPRDILIVIGDEIIESNMGWRSRYFEFRSYRKLIRDYFARGARWTAAPKALMSDEQFAPDYVRGQGWVLTNFEPVFDAADIARFGRDILFQRSNVSNDAAITWLQRHLGSEYRVHTVEFEDDRAMHIDATFVPIAPGKVLVNPARPIKHLPEMFEKANWELLEMPPTTYPQTSPFYQTFKWFHMNVLSLDEKRVIVEKNEEPFIKALKEWGFEPIPVAFRNNYKYGGSFHCATVDVRRRGTLQSYF